MQILDDDNLFLHFKQNIGDNKKNLLKVITYQNDQILLLVQVKLHSGNLIILVLIVPLRVRNASHIQSVRKGEHSLQHDQVMEIILNK